MYDPNSLMYVTKEYENTLLEKAKKIYADNVVKTTLDSVNKQLDDILIQINKRLNEISNKNDEINTYRADVHRFIDSTSINPKDLADSNLGATTSFPSVASTKQNRSYSRSFNSKNFANYKINLNSFDKININNALKDEDNVKSFDIKISDKETIKVVDYVFTYKQDPTIIRKITDSKIVSEEKTVKVTRVFNGRFYIIRPDIDNKPEEIIVKSVIENADNTADNTDIKVLNVREMKGNKGTYYFDNIGPEFDLYFYMSSSDTLTICIGNISPYRWIMRKSSYMIGEDTESKYVNLISGNIDKKFNRIYYSKVINGYILTTDTEIYYTKDSNFKNDSFIKLENIEYNNTNFWVKDAGTYCFIHSANKIYISNSEITNAVSQPTDIYDIKELSNGEIIGIISGVGLIGFDKTTNAFKADPFVTFDGVVYEKTADTEENSFISNPDIIEVDGNKLLVVSTKDNNLQYFFVVLNTTTNTYNDSVSFTSLNEIEVENYNNLNVNFSTIQLISTPIGIYVLVKYTTENGNVSYIYNFKDFTMSFKNYYYKKSNIIKLYDAYRQQEETDSSVIFDRIYETTLGSFAITEDNKLYIFDDTYAIKANITTPITEQTSKVVNEETITETKTIGYDDNNSIIKLDSSERITGQYFNSENPYLNNVLGLVETATGIFIIDEKGVYELTNDLTLKTKLYDNNSIKFYTRDGITNKHTIFIDNTEKTSNFYEMKEVIEENDNIRLRYNYLDLFNGDYSKYDSTLKSYDYDTDNGAEKPIIRFNGKLFVSLIDVTGAIYNNINYIEYSESKYTWGNIKPEITHEINFNENVVSDDGTINKTVVPKSVEIKELIIRTNKHGFIKYNGLTAKNLDTDKISDISDDKLIKITHKSTDTDVSFTDVRAQLLKMMYNYNKNVGTAIGRTEYEYKQSKINDVHKVRLITNGSLSSSYTIKKIRKVREKLYFIPENGNKLLTINPNTSYNYENNSIIVVDALNPTTDNTIIDIKDTSLGTFVWASDGIMFYNFQYGTFTNQLTNYNKTDDGKIIDVVDCKDSRQTLLILCEKAIYAYTCRKTVGSTFSKPISLSTNVTKLTYANLAENKYINYAVRLNNGKTYITSDNSPFLCELKYNGENNIELEEILQANQISSINPNCVGITSLDYVNDNIIIGAKGKYIFKYDTNSKAFSTLYTPITPDTNNNYSNSFNRETKKYLYFITPDGLLKLNKNDLSYEIIDKDFNINGEVYTNNNRVYCSIRNKGLFWLNEENNQYHSIDPLPVYYSDSGIATRPDTDLITTNINVNTLVLGEPQFVLLNAAESIIGEIIDTEYDYKGLYKYGNVDGDGIKTKQIFNDSNEIPYYVVEIPNPLAGQGDFNPSTWKLCKGSDCITVKDNLAFDQDIYKKTTDSTPDSSKEYYTIDSSGFTRAFNISEFNSDINYYISNGNYVYEEVNKQQVINPVRGTEYFIKNINGTYDSIGFNLISFNNNITYYTRKTNYKLVDKNTTTIPSNNENYYVNFNPTYTKVENIGTSFDSSIDYYEKNESTATYNEYVKSIGIIDNKFIYVMKNSDSYITCAYDLSITDSITIIPFKAEKIWKTNVGIFYLYTKNVTTNKMNIGCLTDDLKTIIYDVSDDQITDSFGDLLDIETDINKTILDEQEIYICGKFGVNGKIFKYSPRTENGTANKFNEVASNNLGFKRLFNLEYNVYAIETSSNLNIYKYDGTTFNSIYNGREFALSDVVHKIDETGRDDVYIVGKGDYNIYKSYGDTFKPVFTWFNGILINSINGVISNNNKIAISIKSLGETGLLAVIDNDSDEEFVYFGRAEENELLNQTDLIENKYIPLDYIVSIPSEQVLSNQKGKPAFFVTNSKTTYYSGYHQIDYTFNKDLYLGHALDEKINQCPIRSYDNKQLIYTCFNTDVNTLLPTGEVQALYDSDGTTVKSSVAYFDYYIDSEYGTFGIYKNDVYLNARYSDERSRWIKINELRTTGSSFKTIINTKKLGWILVDDRTVTKFNPITNKFDIEVKVSDWTYDGTTKVVKINYIHEFEDSDELLIGYVTNVNEMNNGIQKPFALQRYNLNTVAGQYQFVNLTYDGTSNTSPISNIVETRFGVMVVVNTYPTKSGTTPIKLTTSNLSQFSTKVGLIGKENNTITNIEFIGAAETGYTWTSVTGTLAPYDLREIVENEAGKIILHRMTFVRTTATNTNISVSTWKLANIGNANVDDETIFDANKYKFVPMHKNTPNAYTDTEDLTKYIGYTQTNGADLRDESYKVLKGYPYYLGIRDSDSTSMFSDKTGSFTTDTFFIEDTDFNNYESTQIETKFDDGNLFKLNNDININTKNFIAKLFYSNGKYYILALFGNNIPSVSNTTIKYIMGTIFEIDKETGTIKQIPNCIFYPGSPNGDMSINWSDDTRSITDSWDLIDFDGVLFVKFGFNENNTQVYVIDSKTLTGITEEKELINKSVLYDLKLTIDNKKDFNNLDINTNNSDIDKFTIKESGIIDFNSYEMKDNELVLSGKNNNRVDQFFLPHDYYTGDIAKEKVNINSLGSSIKQIRSFKDNYNLINNRYINKDSKYINDETGRKTNVLLGEIEDYIKNLDSYSIICKVYPTNVENQVHKNN